MFVLERMNHLMQSLAIRNYILEKMLARGSIMANKLTDVEEKMNLGNKRSFTQAFLDDFFFVLLF